MASKPAMLLGNLASMIVTVAGILQVLSWTIAGATILAILSITTLAPTRSPTSGTATGRTMNKKSTGHSALIETRLPRERSSDKQAARPYQALSRPEPKSSSRNDSLRPPISQARSELQKAMAKITPPKTIPTSVTPSKPTPVKAGVANKDALKPIPPLTRPAVVGSIKPVPARIDPNVRIIDRGDYATYDLLLDKGMEVTCQVTANAPINAYILNEENLEGLDLGEEFWSETGEEGVEKATLSFVASQSGKWFLVVENTDNKQVSATINVKKGSAQTGSA